jgi:hypothetical protein
MGRRAPKEACRISFGITRNLNMRIQRITFIHADILDEINEILKWIKFGET